MAVSLLAGCGADVALVTKAPADQVWVEPARTAARDACAGAGAPRLAIVVNPDAVQLDALFFQADVIVDAILGTGFARREVREPYATWISAANRARRKAGPARGK